MGSHVVAPNSVPQKTLQRVLDISNAAPVEILLQTSSIKIYLVWVLSLHFLKCFLTKANLFIKSH